MSSGNAEQIERPLASRWSFGLAVAVAALTFPLIWVGGLVTTYDAGMAVPDWPGTYGYNLFLYPWQSWLSGPWDLFIEHGHRLLGALVGLVAIGFVLVAWIWDRRPAVRWLSTAVLLGVVGQGAVGGARVVLADARLAQLHGCTGPLFFALAVVAAGLSRPGRSDLPRELVTPALTISAWAVAGLALVQLLLGSVLRHVTFLTPLATFRAAVLLHVLCGFALFYAAWTLWARVRYQARQAQLRVNYLPGLIAAFVSCQLMLGLLTWVLKYGVPKWLLADIGWVNTAGGMEQSLIITAHVALGSLILASSCWWAVRVSRDAVLRQSLWGVLVPWSVSQDGAWEVLG